MGKGLQDEGEGGEEVREGTKGWWVGEGKWWE
jgi:hypothetical protein